MESKFKEVMTGALRPFILSLLGAMIPIGLASFTLAMTMQERFIKVETIQKEIRDVQKSHITDSDIHSITKSDMVGIIDAWKELMIEKEKREQERYDNMMKRMDRIELKVDKL